jgi:hypothetical protein
MKNRAMEEGNAPSMTEALAGAPLGSTSGALNAHV